MNFLLNSFVVFEMFAIFQFVAVQFGRGQFPARVLDSIGGERPKRASGQRGRRAREEQETEEHERRAGKETGEHEKSIAD